MPLTKSNCNKTRNAAAYTTRHNWENARNPEKAGAPGAPQCILHSIPRRTPRLRRPHNPKQVNPNTPVTTTTNPNQNNHATPNLPPPIPPKTLTPRTKTKKKQHAAQPQLKNSTRWRQMDAIS